MRVFAVPGYLSNGGAFMTYHVARIAGGLFGAEVLVATVGDERAETSCFTYEQVLPTVPLERLAAEAGADDLLIVTPSLSSRLLGLRVPGTKVMYVQHVNTYRAIDPFCDHYVAVSRFVADHLRLTSAIDADILPAFVRSDRLPPSKPWRQRDAGHLVVVTGEYGPMLRRRLAKRLASEQLNLEVEVVADRSHADVLDLLARTRTVAVLSALEGFGLVGLEAMASGCTVTGLHGGGGLAYMHPGLDCDVTGWPDVDGALDRVVQCLVDPDRGERLASFAPAAVQGFEPGDFSRRWSDWFRSHLV